MAIKRLYYRNTQLNPGTGGTVYDLNETQGSPAANIYLDIGNNVPYAEVAAFTLTVDDTVTGTSFPTSVVVATISAGKGVRWRIQRRNSSGVVQASSAYATEVLTTGTHTATLTLTTTWATGDRLVVSVEGGHVSGHGGGGVDIATQNADAWVEADITAGATTYDGTGTDTSTATESGGSGVVTGPITHEATGTSSAGAAENSSADSGNTAWPESDVTVGGWTTSPLWSKVNTGLSPDTEFISSDNGSLASELQLTPVTTPSGGVSIFIRARNVTSGNLEVRLVEGTTVRATHTISTLTTTFVEYEVVLTSAEVGSVTDWTNVRVQLTAVAP